MDGEIKEFKGTYTEWVEWNERALKQVQVERLKEEEGRNKEEGIRNKVEEVKVKAEDVTLSSSKGG
ncbi:hypothetical protein ABTK28_20600, partial [Acinetobacter baumannii]